MTKTYKANTPEDGICKQYTEEISLWKQEKETLKVKNFLLKLETKLKEVKQGKAEIKKQLEELKELEKDVWSFKMSINYQTPCNINYHEGYRGTKRALKINLCSINFKKFMVVK